MANVGDILADFLFLIYNFTWLGFLIHKHYRQATTKAGHIFELNYLLNVTICNIFFLMMDTEILPLGTMTEVLQTTVLYSYWLSIACSHIEAAIFLKTFNVNTMMTSTAGKIILVTTIFSFVMGVVLTLVFPSSKVSKLIQSSQWFCTLATPESFFHKTIPFLVILVIVIAVLMLAVFRSRQIRNSSEIAATVPVAARNEVESRDLLNGTPSQDRLFTINVVPSGSGRNSSEDVENDIVVEDIELGNIWENNKVGEDIELGEGVAENIEVGKNLENDKMAEDVELENNLQDELIIETPTSLDQLSTRATLHKCNQLYELNLDDNQHRIQCLPGISILQTLNKYLKNTLISLVILTTEVPWNITALYLFITNSECEIPTIRVIFNMCFVYISVVYLFLPYLVKIKLDRLSE